MGDEGRKGKEVLTGIKKVELNYTQHCSFQWMIWKLKLPITSLTLEARAIKFRHDYKNNHGCLHYS